MTTRFKGLTVTLIRDTREDDAQHIIDAINMIKGVMNVIPINSESDDWIIESRLKADIRSKMYDILK